MKFPTEQETYHRLRWDPRFDVRRVTIVISLRPTGTQRMAFLELDVEAVPWHRIVEFWIDDELAWSRPQRIDRLDELVAGARAAPVASAMHGGLRVVTWNLLFDRYEAERLRSAERWQDAMDRLAALDADVLALCEVTAAMWRVIDAQPWVRGYARCGIEDLEPYGQVILSRCGLGEALAVPLEGGKRAVLATVGDGVRVAAIHLSSNRRDSAAAVRARQLANVRAAIGDAARWIVLGDFNATPAELPCDGDDAWVAVRGDEPGATFDVTRNALARAASRTGRDLRIDRICSRGLVASTCELVGIESGPCGLPPSDHFGIVADFVVAPVETRKLALAIVPPRHLWGAIQRVRCAEDRNWARWPPHVTLEHPWVGGVFALDGVEPFELELDRAATIDAKGRIVVLLPSRRTHAAIARLCTGDVPHLTIGRQGRRDDLPALPIAWTVDRVTVLRDDGVRMVPVRELVFGAREAIELRDDPTPASSARALAVVRKAVPAARVEVFGSTVYVPEHAMDLDLSISGDVAGLAALPLRGAGEGRWRGVIDGVAVDLVEDPGHVGVADAIALRDHLRAHGRDRAFSAAWPRVKAFVHARGLGRNGLGYFGSFGWAMLLAVPLCHDRELCAVPEDRAFTAWLAWLAKLRPHARIGFDAIGADDPAQLYLAAPSPPSRNIARHLTPATAATLFAELRRPRLDDLATTPPAGTTLVVRGDDEVSRGAYEGRVRGLILALGAGIRVWGRFERDGDAWEHRITVPDDAAAQARATLGLP